MRKKRLFGVVAAGVAAAGLVIAPVQNKPPVIHADEISDTQNNISELEKKKKEMSDTLAQLEKEKDDTLVYVSKLDKKLTSLEEEIEKLNVQIDELSAKLETTKKELAAAKKKQNDQYNAMMSRIKYNYENGEDNYLSLLFESESVVDFLNNALYAKEMAEFDKNMYEDFKAAKELVEEKERQLEEELAKLKDLKETQEYEKKTVEDLIAKKKEELEKYKNDIAKSEAQIKSFNDQISQNEAQLEALIAEAQRKAAEAAKRRAAEEKARREAEERARRATQENNNSESGSSSESSSESDEESSSESGGSEYSGVGFIWPCPDSHRITSYFGYRDAPTAGASSYHKGIDIGATSGSTIIASKGGTVITATYSSTAGNYVMISHGDGLFTMYMHASALLVSEGDYVNQGDAIARVGSTGISTGPHLHFAITVDGTYVNPLSFVS